MMSILRICFIFKPELSALWWCLKQFYIWQPISHFPIKYVIFIHHLFNFFSCWTGNSTILYENLNFKNFDYENHDYKNFGYQNLDCQNLVFQILDYRTSTEIEYLHKITSTKRTSTTWTSSSTLIWDKEKGDHCNQ